VRITKTIKNTKNMIKNCNLTIKMLRYNINKTIKMPEISNIVQTGGKRRRSKGSKKSSKKAQRGGAAIAPVVAVQAGGKRRRSKGSKKSKKSKK
jgi:hypothetical protein